MVTIPVLLFFGALKIRGPMLPEHNSKNEIRILIDRLPVMFNESQHSDIAARKIWPLIEEAHYRISSFNPLEELVLEPPRSEGAMNGAPSKPTLRFIYIQDELTRALAFDKGDADVAFSALSLSKTIWLQRRLNSSQFFLVPGTNISFLGFNLTNPVLSSLQTRRAIAQALPVPEWIHERWKDWLVPLKEFNLPLFDLTESKTYFAAQPPISLSYLTTPVREGYETALLMREALKKVGVKLLVQTVEPALYYSRLKKGQDDLFSARMLRFSVHDPVLDYVKTGGEKNYFHYSNPSLDHFLLNNPGADLSSIHTWIEEDLPFVPLYSWTNALILNPTVRFKKNTPPEFAQSYLFLLDLETTTH